MADKPIKINIDEQTKKLAEIRKRLGLPVADVILRLEHIDIDEKFNGNLKDFLHPSGLLVDPKTRSPVFVYIRDHTIGADAYSPPEDLRRVHFTQCSTLLHMDRIGRFLSRYRKTNRTDDIYHVEFSGGRELLRPLRPCKNCLENTGYNCYGMAGAERREEIVKGFKAKDAIDMLWQILHAFKKSMEGIDLKGALLPAGYVSNWRSISRYLREMRKFTCERCQVNLSSSMFLRGLIDVHHKDGDKRNNKNDNFECLCKLCHADEHPHYPVKEEHRDAIEQAREGIFTKHSYLFANRD